MHKIYIILEKSNTIIGKIGRIINPYPYTHIAFSYDKINYYSFSRRYYHNPFDSGFTLEKIEYYAFKDVELKEYITTINNKQKEEITKFLDEIKDYPFDIKGMIKTNIGIKKENIKAYNCMTFMAKILEIIKIPLINEKYYQNNIQDLEKALIRYGLKGEIRKINKMEIKDDYMKKIPLKVIIKSFLKSLKH